MGHDPDVGPPGVDVSEAMQHEVPPVTPRVIELFCVNELTREFILKMLMGY